MWISKQNENGQWTTGDQSATSLGTQETHDCIRRFCFPKSARLLSREEFQRVFHAKNKFCGEVVHIDYRMSRRPLPRLGITVSRRFGKAHVRNHFKRSTREAFRQHCWQFPDGIELNVSPRHSTIIPSTKQIVSDLLNLIEKIERA